MTGARLDVLNLCVRLGRTTILDGFDLTVQPGSIHALVGGNGSGKTTLLDTVFGYRRPTGGRIQLDTRDIAGLAPHRVAQLGVARTFQDPQLCTHLSVRDNLTLARPQPPSTIDSLLQEAGLSANADTPAGALSYGQQRHLELAIALARQPRLLLLDEPTAGFPATDVLHLTRLLRASDRHTSVLLVSHERAFIDTVADTVTNLSARHPTLIDGRGIPTVVDPATTSTAVLEVRNLAVRRANRTILSHLDLDLRGGDIYTISGPNGAGKTTLLHTIAGIHTAAPPSAIHLDGRDLSGLNTARRARLGIGLLPQHRSRAGHLTIAQHLRLVRMRATETPLWTLEQVLDVFPVLRHRLHQRVAELSGGEYTLVALARLLLAQPRVLLLDEPFASLDPVHIPALRQVLTQLRHSGSAVLLVDHLSGESQNTGQLQLAAAL